MPATPGRPCTSPTRSGPRPAIAPLAFNRPGRRAVHRPGCSATRSPTGSGSAGSRGWAASSPAVGMTLALAFPDRPGHDPRVRGRRLRHRDPHPRGDCMPPTSCRGCGRASGSRSCRGCCASGSCCRPRSWGISLRPRACAPGCSSPPVAALVAVLLAGFLEKRRRAGVSRHPSPASGIRHPSRPSPTPAQMSDEYTDAGRIRGVSSLHP